MNTRSEHMQNLEAAEAARANRVYVRELRDMRLAITQEECFLAAERLARDAVVRAIDELLKTAEEAE